MAFAHSESVTSTSESPDCRLCMFVGAVYLIRVTTVPLLCPHLWALPFVNGLLRQFLQFLEDNTKVLAQLPRVGRAGLMPEKLDELIAGEWRRCTANSVRGNHGPHRDRSLGCDVGELHIAFFVFLVLVFFDLGVVPGEYNALPSPTSYDGFDQRGQFRRGLVETKVAASMAQGGLVGA